MRKRLFSALFPALLGLITAPLSPLRAQGAAGGVRVIEEGQPLVVIHATVNSVKALLLLMRRSVDSRVALFVWVAEESGK
jgi:hypothetical protein